MALHPPPTIDNNLFLVAMPLTHTSLARSALLTWACFDSAGPHTAAVLAVDQDGFFKTALQAGFDTDITIGPCKVTLGHGTTTPSVATSTSAATSGTRAEASSPPNCNMLVQKISGLGGRKNRGRLFVPWTFDKANLDELGNLSAGEVSGSQTRFTAWLTALAGADQDMVISNKTFAGSPPFVTAITAGPQVTALSVQPLIASQRRRIGR